MAMNRAQKEKEVETLKARFEEDEIMVITHYSGLSVKQMTELRGKLREEGASFKVTKNTLARRALKGTKFEHLVDMFTGPVGIASSKDPMAAARGTYDFAKGNDKLVILGGGSGKDPLDLDAIKTLALLPSLDELRGTIVGLLQAPGAQLARLMNAYSEKGAAGGEEAKEEPVAEEKPATEETPASEDKAKEDKAKEEPKKEEPKAEEAPAAEEKPAEDDKPATE